MEDKVLCQSVLNKEISLIIKCIGISFLILGGCFFMVAYIGAKSRYHFADISDAFYDDNIIGFYIFLGLGILTLIMRFFLSRSSVTVTENRVYGKTMFGKQVDLPIGQISSVSTSILGGIAVATSSGKIVFSLIGNRNTLYNTISNLVIQRQNDIKAKNNVVVNQQSNADELKKYKDLLELGAISQEEYDAKKKQILGL